MPSRRVPMSLLTKSWTSSACSCVERHAYQHGIPVQFNVKHQDHPFPFCRRHETAAQYLKARCRICHNELQVFCRVRSWRSEPAIMMLAADRPRCESILGWPITCQPHMALGDCTSICIARRRRGGGGGGWWYEGKWVRWLARHDADGPHIGFGCSCYRLLSLLGFSARSHSIWPFLILLRDLAFAYDTIAAAAVTHLIAASAGADAAAVFVVLSIAAAAAAAAAVMAVLRYPCLAVW